jgi:protein FAM32A
MGSDDYKIASGGALKLKGGNVVKKKKKKKTKLPEAGESSNDPSAAPNLTKETSPSEDPRKDGSDTPDALNVDAESATSRATPTDAIIATSLRDEDERLHKELEEGKTHGRFKTEAEKRFDEQRKKRLLERVKREGVKTHKERVEELNRYLSRQSEHHDMYGLAALFRHIRDFTNRIIGLESDRVKGYLFMDSGMHYLVIGRKLSMHRMEHNMSIWKIVLVEPGKHKWIKA